MGSGIAQVAATHGYEVVMRDIDRQRVDAGLDSIERSLARLVERDTPDGTDADAARERITGTTDCPGFAQADTVIEAVVEEMAVKQEVSGDLDRVHHRPRRDDRNHDVCRRVWWPVRDCAVRTHTAV